MRLTISCSDCGLESETGTPMVCLIVKGKIWLLLCHALINWGDTEKQLNWWGHDSVESSGIINVLLAPVLDKYSNGPS
jgi:hypothetical protein